MSHMHIRRVVTGHDAQGRAVIETDQTLAGQVLGDAAEFAMVWSTDRFPSDNLDPFDGAQRAVRRVSPGGSVLQFVNMNPGKGSAMHRTRSLDYGIVLEGEIELVLDDGVTTRLKTGDVIVQRGTIHAWRNPTDRVTRLLFVLLDAQPLQIGDQTLEPVG